MSELMRSSNARITSTRSTQCRSIAPLRPVTHRRPVVTKALLDFFKRQQPAKASSAKPVRPTVVLEPAYNLQAALLVIAGLEFSQGWTAPAVLTGALGALLLFQTTRVQFIFDDEALEVKIGNQEADNIVTGTPNRWPYESFTNWEMWWPAFPVLVYFKETQTKPEGQIHFFPIIFNGKQLFEVMSERCGPRKSQESKE